MFPLQQQMTVQSQRMHCCPLHMVPGLRNIGINSAHIYCICSKRAVQTRVTKSVTCYKTTHVQPQTVMKAVVYEANAPALLGRPKYTVILLIAVPDWWA